MNFSKTVSSNYWHLFTINLLVSPYLDGSHTGKKLFEKCLFLLTRLPPFGIGGATW